MTSVRLSRLAGLVAVALAAATGLVGLSTAAATAAVCTKSGVNVVVDFNGLGGGVQKGCDPGGAGRSADKVFPAAGFRLDYVNGSGFVCKVKNLPGGGVCARTPPADAYWGLYWSDGKSGKWTYATSGVGGTSVPNGGFVAFSWQNGGSADPPGASPVNNQPAPEPTKAPTTAPPKPTKPPAPKPTKKPGPTKTPSPTRTPASTTAPAAGSSTAPGTPTVSASAAARASAGASAAASSSASAAVTLEPTGTSGASPEASSVQEVGNAFTPEEEPSGLPAWVPVTVIVALAGAAGATAWWRRRTGAA